MLPTITDLNKQRLQAANDGAPIESVIEQIVEESFEAGKQDAANDAEDMYEKTMDRIIAKHNGHGRKYRDQKGKFIKREDAVANDKVDFYEKTMDRIMERHNGHSDVVPVADNTNEPLRDFMRTEPLHEYLKKDENLELSGPIDTSKEIIPLLQGIENNTLRTTEVLENIEDILYDINDSMGVDNLRARERDLEEYHKSMAGTSPAKSSMAPEGKKEEEKTGLVGNLVKGAGGLTTAAVGAAGYVADFIGDMLPQQEDNAGGGRKPGATAPKSKPAPKAPPKAPVKPVAPSGAQNREQIKGQLVKSFRGAGFDDKEVAQLMAQAEAESNFKPRSEDLRYSAKTLMRLFGDKVRKSGRSAEQIVAAGPEAIGNLIYGGRMGNTANEGYKYRGRGLIQLTGKENYRRYGKMIGVDLVNNPDLANDPAIAAALAAAYYKDRAKGKKLDTAAKATKATAPKDLAGETRHRAQLAQKYSDSYLDKLESGAGIMTTPAKRGTQLLQQSAQNTAKPNVVVVNSPTTNNTTNVNNSNSKPKPRVPAASPGLLETMKSYFG